MYIWCRIKGFGQLCPRHVAAAWRATQLALPALTLPLLIVGGSGLCFLATEAVQLQSRMRCCGGGLFTVKQARRSIVKAAVLRWVDSHVMVVIAASAPFAYALVVEQVSQALTATLGAWSIMVLML